MTLPFRPLLMAIAVLAALNTPASAQEKSPLTEQQIERFIASYNAMLAMVTRYWGDRRFTPKGVIMPRRGTFERAMVEMEAEGTLQDFEQLFKNHGFDGYDAWQTVLNRIADAQFQIRAMKSGKPVQQLTPQGLEKVLRRRDALRKPNSQLPDEVRLERLKTLDHVLAEHERWQTGLRDIETVKPYMPRLIELGRKRKNAVRAAKNQQ